MNAFYIRIVTKCWCVCISQWLCNVLCIQTTANVVLTTNKDEIFMKKMLMRVIHSRGTVKCIFPSFFKQLNLHSDVCMYGEWCWRVRSSITMSSYIIADRLIPKISDRIYSDHLTNQLLYAYVLPWYINVCMIDHDDNSCRNMYAEDVNDWE